MRLPTLLLRRKNNSHKGDYGHVFVLGGSPSYSGAAVLCAEAAMRSGAGLVSLGIPRSLNNAIIKIKTKEVMTLPLAETKHGAISNNAYKKIEDFLRHIDVMVLGPGLSLDKSTQILIRRLVGRINKPMVVDADGLNALAGHLSILRRDKKNTREEKVLTPHAKEMAYLSGFKIEAVKKNRVNIALDFARRYRVVLVLKGHRTIVAGSQGNLYINETGNPGMATAGSGDVLAGMIGAFWAQGLDAFSASKYAVYLHGLSGDLAAKRYTQLSMIASDIIRSIPEAVKKCS